MGDFRLGRLARLAAVVGTLGEPGDLRRPVATLSGGESQRIRLASQIGSGALPTDTIPSAGLALTPRPEALAERLRGLSTPILGRIHDGALILDLRCLPDDAALIDALA